LQSLNESKKEVFSDAKAEGFDVKILNLGAAIEAARRFREQDHAEDGGLALSQPSQVFSMNGLKRSIGAGKMIVFEFDDAPTSSSVCR